MARTRMNNAHRDVLREFTRTKMAEVIDRKAEEKLFKKILSATNTAIRKKYPEEHLKILKAYQLTVHDNCVKYVFPTGRIDGFSFEIDLADVPYSYTCRNRPPYPMTKEFEEIFDEHQKLKKENDEIYRQKIKDCTTLINFARYVEDVLEVIKVPKEVEYKLTAKSTALVALSPDIIARLQKDFSA